MYIGLAWDKARWCGQKINLKEGVLNCCYWKSDQDSLRKCASFYLNFQAKIIINVPLRLLIQRSNMEAEDNHFDLYAYGRGEGDFNKLIVHYTFKHMQFLPSNFLQFVPKGPHSFSFIGIKRCLVARWFKEIHRLRLICLEVRSSNWMSGKFIISLELC